MNCFHEIVTVMLWNHENFIISIVNCFHDIAKVMLKNDEHFTTSFLFLLNGLSYNPFPNMVFRDAQRVSHLNTA